ncbi:MAG: aldehyde dehydrogenase, partial [Halobacteriovoraceae bacterium]|nr:aldehyde dehydrogenase [Halobacteriovoraceae bacterium]
TGKVYSEVASSSSSDVERAVAAASAAYPLWKNKSREERAAYLKKIASLIERDFEELSKAECIDNGKPIKVCKLVDIPRSQHNLEYFADEILNLNPEKFSKEEAGENTVHYSPLGVVGIISPWNLPLYLFTWKIAPALAAGNTVVAKPSEVTPMTAYLFAKLCIEAGLPPGVLNIVHGLGQNVGDAITSHPQIKAVSFTGSTATGKIVAKKCAESLKKYSLEMGGKNPNIIFADCDFKAALSTTLRSSFANQGQICLCGSRIFVERPIYSKFKDALLEKMKTLRQGDPLDENTSQGAVVSKEHYQKILSCLEVAKTEGGEILAGGGPAKMSGENSNGYFIEPTLIEGLSNNCQTNREEIFGPVATIIPFDDEEEVISMANTSEYGLSGTIWSQDLEKAERVALQIDSGVLWINTWLMRDLRTPFGGMKASGRGREGGLYGLKFFSEMKNICINI